MNKSDEVKGVDIVQNKTVGDKPPMFVHDEEEPKKEKIVIDDSAKNFKEIIFSGGKIGYQVEVELNDLEKVINYKFSDIVKD